MDGSSPPSRKRARPLQHIDNDNSPAGKRRKVSETREGALNVIGKAIGGVLGRGESKQVLTEEDAEPEIPESVIGDEDAPREEASRALDGDVFGSGEDGLAAEAQQTQEAAPSPTPKRGRPRPKKSDSTPRAKRTPNVKQAPKSIEQSVEGNGDVTPTPVKRGRGRPRKDSYPQKVVEVENSDKEDVNDQQSRNTPSRMSARRRSARFEGEETPKGILTPSKGRDGPRKSVAFEIGDPGLGLEVGEHDLGFKDLPTRNQNTTEDGRDYEVDEADEDMDQLDDEDFQVKNKKRQGAKLKEEEDDVLCAICSGADSEEPNEILLCDNCDTPYHQLCVGIPVIPEDDWLCPDCQPEEEDILTLVEEVPIEVESIDTTTITKTNVPDIEDFETHLQITQRLLLQKLTGERRLKLIGLDEEFRKVHQVVEQTVLAGEGNSMLVIGARGSGKTTLVETVISELSSERRDDFHVVRLNGFVHTDDKLALREIWRQLGREMEVEDELIGKTNNYADTLASLLALLSHPSELDQSNADHTAKSVVFILDEFDLFTAHPRQTLLYNLFDIAQARKAPIAVLGVTTRIDVVESLEKRVKSRFSHRYVHLSLTRNLASFWDVCKEGLLIDEYGTDDDSLDHGASAGWFEFLEYWSSMIENLYANDATFMQHLQTLFYRTKSVPEFFASAILAVASLAPTNVPLKGSHFTSSLAAPDSKLTLLPSLSDLELALLICAARLDIILDTDTCNFSMAYDEYCTLTSRHKIQSSSTGIMALGGNAKVWGREVAVGAWERLVEIELLMPAAMGATREGGREGKMWRVDIALEEIAGSVSGLNGIMSRWCREI